MIGALTNHLWQSTACAAVVAVLAIAFRRNRAAVRYALWLCASVKFLVPFTALSLLGAQLQRVAPSAQKIAVVPVVFSTVSQIGAFVSADVADIPPASQPASFDWRMAFVAVWACGFAAIALTRCRAWLRIRAMMRESQPAQFSGV